MSFQATFKALSDPTRREILQLLRQGARSAGEIAEHFDMTGATISHHLSILKNAGLVDADRHGTYIYYELNLSVLEEILSWMKGMMEDTHEKNK
ncbi:MAG: autorepressor SdpR family transcription factor [Eubacteriales bacterium]|nr:autorepressor SdpR family transcription factor [Eubacteriales bacterium]